MFILIYCISYNIQEYRFLELNTFSAVVEVEVLYGNGKCPLIKNVFILDIIRILDIVLMTESILRTAIMASLINTDFLLKENHNYLGASVLFRKLAFILNFYDVCDSSLMVEQHSPKLDMRIMNSLLINLSNFTVID